MRAIILALAILGYCRSYAQVGISGSYVINNTENWNLTDPENTNEEINLLGNGWQASADYWLRLKNLRIEFFPTLQYGQFRQELSDLNDEMKNQSIAFLVKTNFYLLNLLDDCDCPTFSKQNSFLQRGLFIQLVGGVGRLQQTLTNADLSASTSYTKIGIGAGIDIGLSDLVTLTPNFGWRYLPTLALENDELLKTLSLEATETSASQIVAGLRLGFRFDY